MRRLSCCSWQKTQREEDVKGGVCREEKRAEKKEWAEKRRGSKRSNGLALQPESNRMGARTLSFYEHEPRPTNTSERLRFPAIRDANPIPARVWERTSNIQALAMVSSGSVLRS